MKTKSILKSFLGLVGMMSMCLAGAEAETLTSQMLWSGSMLFICVLSFKGFEALMTDEEKEERV
jgi:uncharacterized membrane protein YjfL (UPF0719 family)